MFVQVCLITRDVDFLLDDLTSFCVSDGDQVAFIYWVWRRLRLFFDLLRLLTVESHHYGFMLEVHVYCQT